MERLTGLMTEVAEREVARWPRDEPVELHPRLQALTLEIILRAVFGLDPGPRLDALRERLQEMLEFGDQPISLMPPPAAAAPRRSSSGSARSRTSSASQAEADELIFELIDERRARGRRERDDMLSMLLAARHEDGSPMSDQELRDELMTLLVAGHETTASSLAWAFERLAARARACCARLVEEVDAGDGDDYLTATIHETLRRRPVLPNAAPRLVKQPIEVGGWTYPPGVRAGRQRLPRSTTTPTIYPDPYAFRPERFLDEPPGTYTWIPFGGGRRRCLGASFALLEMKIVLRAVLRRTSCVRQATGCELARRRNITIRPAEGAGVVLGAADQGSQERSSAVRSPPSAVST